MLLILSLLACGTPDYSNGDAVAGADVYAASCKSCHGADGKLGVEVGGTPAADLVFETGDLTDDEIASAILDGVGTMPAQSLTDTEAADCIAYMRATFTSGDTGGDTATIGG
jgi:mono/diheme cytochrome c family protein